MRDDIFIIWGDGINHLEEIIEILRDEYATIHSIKRYDIINMKQFIIDIYKCDAVSIPNIVEYKNYLFNSYYYCFCVYLRNDNPQEKYYGEGNSRHIQCARIKATKDKIRNKFNPRDASGKITDQHVVHATDFESQVIYLKKMLGI